MTSPLRTIVDLAALLTQFNNVPRAGGTTMSGDELLNRLVNLAEAEPTIFNAYFVDSIDTNAADYKWRQLFRSEGKISAIKEYRAIYGVGLGEAKTRVEQWAERTGAVAYQYPR